MFVPFILCWYAGLTNLDNPCPKPLHTFLILEGIVFMCNFAAAVYILYRIGKQAKPDESPDKRKTVYQRAWKTVGYDCWVCAYIIELIFGMVWTSIGAAWVSDVNDDGAGTFEEQRDKDECKNDHALLVDTSTTAVVLFWVYLVVGIALFIITLCVMSWQEDGETGCEGCLDCVTCYLCGFKKASKKRKKKLEERRLKKLGLERKNSRSDKFLGFMGFGKKREQWMEKKGGQQPKQPKAKKSGSACISMPCMGSSKKNKQPSTNDYQHANQGPQGGQQAGYQGGPQGGYQGGPQGGYQGGPQGGYQGGPQGGYQGGPQGGNQGGPQGGFQGGYQGGPQGGYQGGPQGGYQGGSQSGYQGGPQGGYQGGYQGGQRS